MRAENIDTIPFHFWYSRILIDCGFPHLHLAFLKSALTTYTTNQI